MQAPELHWTHRWPTQAGWYWSKFIPYGRKKETAIVVLHVIRNGSNKLRVGTQSLEAMCEFGERLWAGPLEPPHASEIED